MDIDEQLMWVDDDDVGVPVNARLPAPTAVPRNAIPSGMYLIIPVSHEPEFQDLEVVDLVSGDNDNEQGVQYDESFIPAVSGVRRHHQNTVNSRYRLTTR